VSREAEAWTREHSRANGSARSLMFALARFAKGCLVLCRAIDLEREARISRAQLYRCLTRVEDLGEIERTKQHHEKTNFREFHIVGFCKSQSLNEKCPLTYRKRGQISDLRRTSLTVSSLLPFPRAAFSQDDCEECRGTGYKDLTIQMHDGQPHKVVIPCAHEIAAISGGRWKPIETWQDQFLHRALACTPDKKSAEQITLAEFQERLRREELRQQREKILREHPQTPVQPEEQALPANVIVMKRKTA